MNKTETAKARREIRTIKSHLTSMQKRAAREIKTRRDLIRKTEREITIIERDLASFAKTSTDRLAILEGRLNS